jgi:hypothetical protein
MSGRYETHNSHRVGIRCHCSDVLQRASTDRDIRFTVRVHRVHGINRCVAKTDLSPVPSDKSAIQAIVSRHCDKIGVKHL